jgi:HAD superfamily hydrolase (TIGR01484 family)
MKPLKEFSPTLPIEFLLTDIDDTITDHGKLGPESYQSLWDLSRAGIKIIPITGRPAGWCEMIARFWPVAGVVGENGAFYFRHHGKMIRHFSVSEDQRKSDQTKLKKIENEILKSIKGAAIASDQFSRISDLAIDFCEDVPALSKSEIAKIVDVFTTNGAVAKVSSIHVNGWFGSFDKISCSIEFLKNEFGCDIKKDNRNCVFVGDSPNDEPMFGFFENSIGVANVKNFLDQIKSPPKYLAPLEGGAGFVQVAKKILSTIA